MLLSKTAWEPNIFSKECYSMDLLTNATVVDDAIRFETQGHNLKGKLKDYEYNKQLGYNNNAQGEEGHTEEGQRSTINQIF
jgi:hypothetical protein